MNISFLHPGSENKATDLLDKVNSFAIIFFNVVKIFSDKRNQNDKVWNLPHE